MQIKYFTLDLQALISLKDYVCSCIGLGEVCTERAAIRSLTQLMCEFDTMSENGEVLDALYSSIIKSLPSQASLQGICNRVSDFRGIVEGIFKQR